MTPVTPTKRKGSMGPPMTPTSSSSSRALVVRAATPSSRERGISLDRDRVKTEPLEYGTPSPSSRSMTPYSRAGSFNSTPGSAPSRAVFPSQSRSPQRLLLTSEAQRERSLFRTPSVSPSPRGKRPRTSSLAPSSFSEGSSDAGTPFRLATEDFDTRVRRNNRARESGTVVRDAPQPISSLAPLPPSIDDGVRVVVEVVEGWYVQDVDGEDDDTLAKAAFKKTAIELVIDCLFQGGGMAEAVSSISAELKEGDIVVAPTNITRLISALEVRVSSMLSAGVDEFVKEGMKGKLDQRKATWYSSYKEGLVTVPETVRARLSLSDAQAVVSLLAEHWTTTVLNKLLADGAKLSKGCKKLQCKSIIDECRRLCDTIVKDIKWEGK